MKKGSSKKIEPYSPNPADELSPVQHAELLQTLADRFAQNMHRHEGLDWAEIQDRLEARPRKLWSLNEMERTGGEPDVIGHDAETGEAIFYDCAPESPEGRRSICYDPEGREEREKKGIFPRGSALGMAEAMGIELLTEEQYRALQEIEPFDTKTSSWVKTPPEIYDLGGALFMDRRYDHVFVYHNSAPSFYGSRGFRGALRV